MATLKVDVLRREGEGPFPVVVRTAEGRVLRLHGDAAPRHARWFGMSDGVAVWAEPADAAGASTGEVVEVHVEELIDEVGVAVGPDRDHRGIFDPPGESSLTGERTGASTEEAGVETQRTAVLAWIAASLGEPHALPASAPPSAALRTRIADEAPDLLPSLAAPPTAKGGRVLRTPPAAPLATTPERDDTETRVDLLPPAGPPTDAGGATTTGTHTLRWLTAERMVWVGFAVAACLLAGSALAWWWWVPGTGWTLPAGPAMRAGPSSAPG